MIKFDSIVFGPINSRRLGRSLGVNLIPHKTCNMDCVYCECGKTTNFNPERMNYFSPELVIKKVFEEVQKQGQIDFITFAGDGEPSLYKDLKKVILGIKSNHPDIKIAMITNTSLIGEQEVFDAFLETDLLLPSVDTVNQESFKKINRPHSSVDLNTMLKFLLKFRELYMGEIWVEVFICKGINDTEKELKELKEYFEKLRPHRIQINTLDRLGTESWVTSISKEELQRIGEHFKNISVVDIISKALTKDT